MIVLRGVLTILYSISLRSIVLALSSFPNGLNSNCICAEESSGFSFECNGVNTLTLISFYRRLRRFISKGLLFQELIGRFVFYRCHCYTFF